jgi:spermidine/putrescine transport system ATP-binding protein
VRPEKVHLDAGDGAAAVNALPGGIVIDASFTGTSTQYLVRLPSGRQLSAFAQNTGRAAVLPVGTRVTICWEPAHTFALDGAEDAAAGTETEDGERPPTGSGPAELPGIAELTGSPEPRA